MSKTKQNKYILGFNCIHGISYCFVNQDGEIEIVMEEERYNRTKLTWQFTLIGINEYLKGLLDFVKSSNFLKSLKKDCSVNWLPHHKAHAASAYYTSGFNSSAILVQCKNPCPEGKVRVQWLCHLNGVMLLQGRVIPTTFNQGVTNELISQVITNNLALPISYYMGSEISFSDIGRGNRNRSRELYPELF